MKATMTSKFRVNVAENDYVEVEEDDSHKEVMLTINTLETSTSILLNREQWEALRDIEYRLNWDREEVTNEETR